MVAVNSKFESLGSKESFNSSVRHVKMTVTLAERVAVGENIADAINELLDEKLITLEQVQAFVSMLLVDKFGYVSVSKNLMAISAELSEIHENAKSWNAIDLVVLYHHPDLGVLILNPKNPGHLSLLDRLNKFELITVYAGGFSKGVNAAIATKAAETLISLYEGKKAKVDASLLKGGFSYKAKKAQLAEAAAEEKKADKAKKAAAKLAKGKKSAKAAAAATQAPQPVAVVPKPPAPPKAGARMTPMYAVPVSNELFHNGNVEAWKRIIESYKTKHPDLEVLVYYDGERITNLNALFKWGKVKHGSVIQFAVAGENICDVAKLQRYLAQGASKMFEAFLRGPVNSVLPLF